MSHFSFSLLFAAWFLAGALCSRTALAEHSFSSFFYGAHAGIIGSRAKVSEKDFPWVGYIENEKGYLVASAVLVEGCVMTVSHADLREGQNFRFKLADGRSFQIGGGDERTFRDTNFVDGKDVAVFKLEDGAPVGFRFDEDLVLNSFVGVSDSDYDHGSTFEELAEMGTPVTLVAFGHSEDIQTKKEKLLVVAEKVGLQAKESPNSADFSAQYRILNAEMRRLIRLKTVERTNPQLQLGDVRVIGLGKDFVMNFPGIQRVVTSLRETSDEPLNSILDRVRKHALQQKTLNSENLMALPGPSRAATFDSGGAAFIEEQGKQKLLGLIQGFDQKTHVTRIAPLDINEAWLRKSMQSLGCIPKPKRLLSSMDEQTRSNR